MKNFSALSNEALHDLTLASSQNEKNATLVLLEHLAEVDARRLYAVMGYSSLWEYVHLALHYSESQSSERVSAMRLIVRVPAVRKELENGNLTLTSTAKLASHVRREKTSTDDTVLLLKEISGKASREVEKVLASESTAPAKPDQVKIITQDLTRITIEVDEEFLVLMNRMKEIKGHPGSTPKELFKAAMQTVVKKKDSEIQKTKPSLHAQKVTRAPKVPKTTTQTVLKQLSETETPIASPFPSRYISKSAQIQIRTRSQDQCEYESPNHRRCQNQVNLQFDHAVPFAKGGENTVENLRHYCAAHNRLWAIQSFGVKKMEGFLT